MVPKFDLLYSGNEYVRYLSTKKINIKEPIFINKHRFNGENIRKLILNHGKWENLVPNAVKDIIVQINGVERIRVLAISDTHPQEW
jgi:nicotinamide-nucleotide adenylyltransferase